MRHPIVGVELDQARADEAVSRWSTAHRNSPVYEQVIVGDFLELHDGLEVCATIGNPPFSHAQEFVDHARSTFKGPVCFLLRVSFLESKKRAAWWRANPANVYVLSQRPSFCWTYTCEADADHPRRSVPVGFKGELRCAECEAPMRLSSTSDSAAYGWFIWGDGPRGRLEVLPC